MRPASVLKTSFLVTAISLALVAACGGDGAAGLAGAAGAAGPSGSAGAAGAAGATGAPGLGLSDGDGGLLILTLSERARRGLEISPVPLALAGKTAAQIEEIGNGSYLANALAECTSCHTPPGPPGDNSKYFAGGIVFPIGAPPLAVVSRNLTPDPATGLKDTEEQWIQASQNGTDILNTGSALILHPWQHHRWLSTADLKAVYAFLKVIPPVSNSYAADNKPSVPATPFPGRYNEGEVERPLPPETEGPNNAPIPDPDSILRGLAIVPVAIPFPEDPEQLALFGRGSYVINAGSACSACHTNPDRDYATPNQRVLTAQYFTGGRVFPAAEAAPAVGIVRSMSANLIGQTHGYFNDSQMSFQVFLTTMTRGVHGTKMDADGGAPPLAFPMPYGPLRNLTTSDLLAVYTYFRWTAEKKLINGNADKRTQSAARYCGPGVQGNTFTCLAGETCDATTHECVGRACTATFQCDACQTCTANVCVAPAANSTCLVGGL
jgi:hypothetical protein